ncbi:DUF3789 domain-containing protein [Caproicibacterium sp. XB2]|uniref:DUF3789 domain-containing protein n=1 Tax=Caproicibacterium lactatifermentans TaxID=2666138 RepID=A0A859DTD9_9FIRM|nr:DUF3789 domain-containing protein [Caproicibacterium lactatifermentans]
MKFIVGMILGFWAGITTMCLFQIKRKK